MFETWIPFRLAKDADVSLRIYTAGSLVRTIELGHHHATVYETKGKAAYWDGRNNFGEQVASGVYFYRLQAGDYSQTRKMVILK
ncbi:TPA: T9SS type A sorting domain-containing protein [Candidatus Poribacteria bacterium]|nr:T9SS type A sorting domain-containing protein [Candidatus Poribacteria bacterium]HIN74561.1 T9SS type A sorting domain-containing protein [Rhodospirillales bacterium]HIO79992.1 T9SS type A sorting domain-containing protein [Candidatus Poribacteria bacterium]